MGGEEGVIVVFVRVLLAAHEQHVLQVVAQALSGPGRPERSGCRLRHGQLQVCLGWVPNMRAGQDALTHSQGIHLLAVQETLTRQVSAGPEPRGCHSPPPACRRKRVLAPHRRVLGRFRQGHASQPLPALANQMPRRNDRKKSFPSATPAGSRGR